MNHDADKNHGAVVQNHTRGDHRAAEKSPCDAGPALIVAESSLLTVLEALESEPATSGYAGIFDALEKTGCSPAKRLDAVWLAEAQGFFEEIVIQAADRQHKRCTLSALGLDALERLRFEGRTRITSRSARAILGDIEKEMVIEARCRKIKVGAERVPAQGKTS
jgi:hypothetical protein